MGRSAGAGEPEAPQGGEAAPDLATLEEDATRAALEQALGAAVAEPLDQAVARLERELGEWKDRALRAAADLDNYRKRAAREREEVQVRVQGELLGRILEVVDDLARVAHLDPAATSSEALHEGMLQIERKFLRVLEGAGVERIDPAGEAFDPNLHEAVTVQPAPSPDLDGCVGAVFQHGYRFRGILLRPARVSVLSWQQGSAEAAS